MPLAPPDETENPSSIAEKTKFLVKSSAVLSFLRSREPTTEILLFVSIKPRFPQ